MIPEGIKAKALALGVSVEERQRGLVARPRSFFRFTKGHNATRWMSLAEAHTFLDDLAHANFEWKVYREERSGRMAKETGHETGTDVN